MITFNTEIKSLMNQIATGRKEQTPLERMREIESQFEQSRITKAKELSERLEIRISQQADNLQLIDENLNRARELMIDINSYNPENEAIVNTELTELRNGLVGLLNSQNIQDELMFSFDREQYDGNDGFIQEFGDDEPILNAINIIDNFIFNKDQSLLEDLDYEQDRILVELTRAGLKMQRLDQNQDIATDKLLRYKEIESMNTDVDMAEVVSRLTQLKAQQEAVYKAEALVGNMSLFDYI